MYTHNQYLVGKGGSVVETKTFLLMHSLLRIRDEVVVGIHPNLRVELTKYLGHLCHSLLK